MNSRNSSLALVSPIHSVSSPPREDAVARLDGERSGRILFALAQDGEPTASLQLALQICDAFDYDLDVLRVLPELTRLNPIFPHFNVVDAMRAVDRTLAALRSTQSWLKDTDPGRSATTPVEVRSGAFVEQVAARAAEMGAELIVLPPCEGSSGSTATLLARASRVPVLVARAPNVHNGILAASDLQDPEYPVLQLAESMGRRLDAPVVAVHNLAPISTTFGLDFVWPTVESTDDVMGMVQAKLDGAIEHWQVASRSVIAVESNPADAILKEARSRNADLIVIGTRPHSWFDQIFGYSTADQVIAQAQRSVLITPIGAYN